MVNTKAKLGFVEEIQLLTFMLDKVLYGVNVNQVREVKNFEGATPVPYSPGYVKGVTNLRGEVVPVVDLRRRFGISDKKDEETSILIVVQDKQSVAVMVDSVLEVLTLPKKSIESNPESLIVDNSESVLGVAKHDTDLVILLDLLKIASQETLKKLEKEKCGFQIQVQNSPKP